MRSLGKRADGLQPLAIRIIRVIVQAASMNPLFLKNDAIRY